MDVTIFTSFLQFFDTSVKKFRKDILYDLVLFAFCTGMQLKNLKSTLKLNTSAGRKNFGEVFPNFNY